MAEDEFLLYSSTDNGLSEKCRTALSILEAHSSSNTFSICCKKFRIMSHARDVTIEEQWIYIAYLCTLAEQRWSTKKSLPYNGTETCPNNPVGDIWQDYEFDSPKKTVLDAPALSLSKDLEKTRRREDCSQCQNNEAMQCSYCKGRRSIVTWTQLNVKWFNSSSTIFFSSNNQNFCPQSVIQTATNKIKFFEFNDIWTSTENTLDDILNTCDDLPEEFCKEMNKRFLILQRSDKILRLKCIIERLRVQKINYQLNGVQDESFTFYLVGEDKKLYADESSYPTQSQHCKTTCILM